MTRQNLGGMDGTMFLTVNNAFVPMRTQLDVAIARCPLDDHEPNGNPDDASPLTAGTTVSDLVVCGGESDWYVLDAIPAGQRLELTLESHTVVRGGDTPLFYGIYEIDGAAATQLASGQFAEGEVVRYTNSGSAAKTPSLEVTTFRVDEPNVRGNIGYALRYDILTEGCSKEPWETTAPQGAPAPAYAPVEDPAPCPVEGVCGDHLDNDGDGQTDCGDPRCFGRTCDQKGRDCDLTGACTCPYGEAWEQSCGDGVDNDCDGLVDCEDPDCPRVWCCTADGFGHTNAACEAACTDAGGAVRVQMPKVTATGGWTGLRLVIAPSFFGATTPAYTLTYRIVPAP